MGEFALDFLEEAEHTIANLQVGSGLPLIDIYV